MSFYNKLPILPLFYITKNYIHDEYKLALWISILILLTIRRINKVLNKFTKQEESGPCIPEDKINQLLNEKPSDRFTEIVFRNVKSISLSLQLLEIVFEIGVFHFFPNYGVASTFNSLIFS